MGLVGQGYAARGARALLCGTAIALLAGTTIGQAQDEAATTTDEQVTTENQKKGRATALQRLVLGAGQEKVAIDTPQAVTVKDQKDIDDAQATTASDLVKDTPGVSITGSERVLGEAFNIRGIGSTENSADGSRIVVNVDGAQKFYEQYRMGSFFSDPELYKRVEILRGPASSTLYGAGALGGVINFVTKDAADFIRDGDSTALRLKGAYESNGDGYLGSAIMAHRFNDNLEFLLTGNYRGSDDFRLGNGMPLVGSEFTAWSGLAKATARFGDNNEQVLRFSYQQWQSNADDQTYTQTGYIPIFGTVDRDVADKTAIISYENPVSDNPWLDIKASVSYSNTTVKQRNGSLTGPGTNIIDADYGYETFQANLQNTSEFRGDNWENFLTYGFQASHQKRVGRSLTTSVINTHPQGIDNKLGLFVQDEFVWDDRLTVIAGVRGDFVRREPDSTVVGGRTITDVAFSPKIAALYKFNENFGVFGSVARTERLPTLDELFTWSGGVSLDLKKEESLNYEAGFTVSGYDLLTSGDTLQLKTTGFYNDLENLIQVTPTSAANPRTRYFENIGKARIYGVEVEAAYSSDYVFASLGYTGIKGENLVAGPTYGNPLATIPAHKIVGSIGGRLPDYGLDFGVRVIHAMDAPNSVLGTVTAPRPTDDWTTADVFLNWVPTEGPMQGWEARFAVNNVFDAYYRDNLSLDYARGRNFKLTLSKQFGW